MKQIPPVELTVSSLINDLYSGLSWFIKDDIGYGSIQAKYDATGFQIQTIMQHPKLVHIEPVRVFFTLIDDTEPKNTSTQESETTGPASEVRESVVDLEFVDSVMESVPEPRVELQQL